MEKILKKIKNDLLEIKKQENWKYKRYSNSVQEVLEYLDYFTINRKKHFFSIRFILQKEQKSLSVVYNIQFHSKNLDINEIYSFENQKQTKLPGIKKENRERLLDVYEFRVIDNQIVNMVPLETQYEVIMSVFKDSIQNIMKYAKNINKKRISD